MNPSQPPSNPKKIEVLSDLSPDPHNANQGSDRGNEMISQSLQKYGAGRSIVVDRNGVTIGGAKTLEQARALGLEIAPVHTTGEKLVVVVRDDLDLASDPKARELAYADNRAAEVSLKWDPDQIQADMEKGVDLSLFWSPEELDKEVGELASTGGRAKGDDDPEKVFTLEFLEAHNYLLLVFNNEVDWQTAQEKFGVQTVNALKSKPGTKFEMKGRGRVLDGAVVLGMLP